MVRAAEDVAAHPPLLRGGEERERAGGRAGQEGLAIQAPGKKLFIREHQLVGGSLHIILSNKLIQMCGQIE